MTFQKDITCHHIHSPLEQGMTNMTTTTLTSGTSGPTDPMLQFFTYDHLPARLQQVSKPFALLAQEIVLTYPRNPERTAGLRKLLEAKDCIVRASIYKDDPPPRPAPSQPFAR